MCSNYYEKTDALESLLIINSRIKSLYLLGKGDNFRQEVYFQLQNIPSATTSGSGAFNSENATWDPQVSLLNLQWNEI